MFTALKMSIMNMGLYGDRTKMDSAISVIQLIKLYMMILI